jgi:hypothetical protein
MTCSGTSTLLLLLLLPKQQRTANAHSLPRTAMFASLEWNMIHNSKPVEKSRDTHLSLSMASSCPRLPSQAKAAAAVGDAAHLHQE